MQKVEGYDYRALLEHLEEPFALFELIHDGRTGEVTSYALKDMNEAYATLFGFDSHSVYGRRIESVMHTKTPPFLNHFKTLALQGGADTFKRYYASLGKTYRFSVMSNGDGVFAVLMFDLSDRETLKQKMHDLIYKDSLTGLYNRRYYEEAISFFVQDYNLPLTVVLIDINALKLANDAFGHDTGDELIRRLSGMIKECLKDEAWMARIGGDEFVVLIPRMEEDEAQAYMEEMSNNAFGTQVKHIKLSFSYGVATMRPGSDYEIVYKKAENQLYACKLRTAADVRRRMLQLIEKTLHEKAPWEKGHLERVRNLSLLFARALELTDEETHRLSLAARFHDIGKTAINPAILNKKTPLTDKEVLELNRHPEVGFRIMGALNAYGEIAQYILKHHENIDGSGYPLGVKADDIPLISRILRITEAYDAMVSDRPGSPAVLPHAAQAELDRKKGEAFDEALVDIFLRRIVPLEETLSVLSGALVIKRGRNGIKEIGFSKTSVSRPKREDPLVREARTQIERYLKGDVTEFDFPLEIQGTPFQKEVYETVRHIPYGEVWTYGDIAKHLNRPGAARAVGRALNNNPLPLAIPCHRVVGTRGNLVGFASGVPLKRALLSHEGKKPIER